MAERLPRRARGRGRGVRFAYGCRGRLLRRRAPRLEGAPPDSAQSPRHPVTPSPCHLVTLSPCHLVTLSPCHLVTLSPCHLGIQISPLFSSEIRCSLKS